VGGRPEREAKGGAGVGNEAGREGRGTVKERGTEGETEERYRMSRRV
jgi:hypothetical protein